MKHRPGRKQRWGGADEEQRSGWHGEIDHHQGEVVFAVEGFVPMLFLGVVGA